MKNKNNKDVVVVDLVQGRDGVYEEAHAHHPPPAKIKQQQVKKNKDKEFKRHENVDNFFTGIDAGLDFYEGIEKRLLQIFKR